jgi:hypothetical protein
MANPTGKGGFKDHPELINKNGAPKRGQSWQETVKRLTDMTRDELIAYVGKTTKLGKLLKELPPDVPVKDALILISIIQYGRDPNPRLLAALMDREEGKPVQPIGGDPNAPLRVVVEYADTNSQDNPAETTPGTDPDQE